MNISIYIYIYIYIYTCDGQETSDKFSPPLQKIYPGPICDVILKCESLRSHDVFGSEELGCFGRGSHPFVIPSPFVMPYSFLGPFLFVASFSLNLKPVCDSSAVRDFLFLIARLFISYLLSIIYLLFLNYLLFLIQLLCLIYLLFFIFVCVRRRERPSHGPTLALRYTAHIVAKPVFGPFLAAPAGGF